MGSKEKDNDHRQQGDEEELITKDLVRSAQVIDHAISFLEKEGNSSLAIASACLGASLSLLARDMDKEPILHILKRAEENVRSGEIHASLEEEE